MKIPSLEIARANVCHSRVGVKFQPMRYRGYKPVILTALGQFWLGVSKTPIEWRHSLTEKYALESYAQLITESVMREADFELSVRYPGKSDSELVGEGRAMPRILCAHIRFIVANNVRRRRIIMIMMMTRWRWKGGRESGGVKWQSREQLGEPAPSFSPGSSKIGLAKNRPRRRGPRKCK